MRSLYLIGVAYLGVGALALIRGPMTVEHITIPPVAAVAGPTLDGAAWFRQAKPNCNALEVESVHRRYPPPSSLSGVGFSAACWALAGRTDEAHGRIMTVEEDERWKAAGIVFAVGHPIADMGDDLSAGPIMELVVEFWPNHYQALYHAGAARYATGEYEVAAQYLRAFLEYYDQSDGWTRNAHAMLEAIGSR